VKRKTSDILFPLSKGGSGVVSLKVFDITGREVAVLVNENLKPGNYEVTFDGNNLSSGIYFYKLSAGDYIQTKKMILIK
jgi:5-hydroxyisourate hydrolase-like protein (transthyretin family)